jgi:hypothetical protein
MRAVVFQKNSFVRAANGVAAEHVPMYVKERVSVGVTLPNIEQ